MILKTQNELWGFWGTTLNDYLEEETQNRWNEAFETLLHLSGKNNQEIREFLDSRYGRHLANACCKGNVKQRVLETYFSNFEYTLFEDECVKENTRKKDKTMFGVEVYNRITKQVDVLLYTWDNPKRINKQMATCINKNEKNMILVWIT